MSERMLRSSGEEPEAQADVPPIVIREPEEAPTRVVIPERRADDKQDQPGGPGEARGQYRQLYLCMAITDIACVTLAFDLAALASAWLARVVDGGGSPSQPQPFQGWPLLFIVPFLVLGIFSTLRLYSAHQLASAEEFRRVLLAVTLVVTSAVTVSFWVVPAFTTNSIAKPWILLSWVFGTVLALANRYAWRRFLRKARGTGRYSLRTLIVGVNEEAGRVAIAMKDHPDGFIPVGYVCTDSWGRPTMDLPMAGHVADLESLIEDYRADCLFVAASGVRPADVSLVSNAARRTGIEVRVTAGLHEVLSTRINAQPVGGVMALSLRPVRLSGIQALAKRAFDLGVTIVGSIALLPVLVVIAIGVKLTSSGPVFFAQERIGFRGTPFRLLKFRTMVDGADEMVETLLDLNEATGPLFKIKDDPRMTPVGKVLRKWSLDELPQLINVLRGDMSLVGPRPALAREVSQFEEWMMSRLEVRPGITGLWQVSGRSELPFEDYVRLDLFYIENWSLAYDLFILAKTVPIVVTAKGAR